MEILSCEIGNDVYSYCTYISLTRERGKVIRQPASLIPSLSRRLSTMAQQHKNFQSYIPEVKNASDISNMVGTALTYQYMFERKTDLIWNQDELQNFTVELDMVDRLYDIDYNSDASGSSFYLMVRMEYKNKLVFVKMNASCDYSGIGGQIFITINPDLPSVRKWKSCTS